MEISKNKVVTFDYTLTGDDGVVLDSSKGGEPLAYIHGIGSIISGLEAAMEGKKTGDSFQATIPPEKGYGVYDESRVLTAGKENFTQIKDLKVGMPLELHSDQGNFAMMVSKIEEDKVTLDGNHPLAGKTLHFDVAIASVREAEESELSHKHPHGAGTCEHD
jgi:FKBP-type peptidyl-prolyl cis-trans isomerase SlyD